MVLKNTRKKKPKQVEDIGNLQDKISSLPDELIHRILSLVPTKCAISTCILSKRWKCISNSIPKLDFLNWQNLDENSTRKERKQQSKAFMNFLDTVLYHHDKPYIHKFYLHLDCFFDASRVSKWISTIVNRKVEEFCLFQASTSARYPQYSTSSIFPLSFFTCDSFTLLDLHFSHLAPCKFDIPNTVCFPNLKRLRLRWVSFVNEASNRKFFSSCPILEDLRLVNCEMYEGLHIANPALKNLVISYCFFGHSSVEICAPVLLTISYNGAPPADFVLNNIPSLVKSDVDFDYPMVLGDPKVFVKLFEKISSVKHLKISAHSFQVLREADTLSTGSFTFNNLIQLEIGTDFRSISGLDSISKVRTLFKLLQMSPNLESILFAQSIGIPGEEADGCRSLDPKCLPPHLKSIKFMVFDGEPAELNLIELFLKYARFLETVTVVPSPALSKDQGKQLNVMKLLVKFPRPANCVVDVL